MEEIDEVAAATRNAMGEKIGTQLTRHILPRQRGRQQGGLQA